MDFKEIRNIEITDFSTSATGKSCLLRYEDRYFEVNTFTATLFGWLQKYDSQEEAVTAYIQQENDKHSKEAIDSFIASFLAKLDSNGVAKKTFLFKRELLSASVINTYSKLFKILFRKEIMAVVGLIFLLFEGFFFFHSFTAIALPEIDFYTIGALLLFFVCSSLFHELGHASACQYYDIPHGGIGFGLYVNFPVFYTDVSAVWRLSRSKRCVVNIAGVYFQILLLIPLSAFYFYTQNEILKYIILMMNINFLITLNPFFKFDGYWLMTDLLGVANLRQKGNECLAYLWKRVRKKPIEKKPYLFSLRKKEKVFMLIYTSVMNLFFGYYFFYLLPSFFIRFYDTFPLRFKLFMMSLANHQAPDFHNIQQMVVQLFFLGLTIYMLYKTLVPLFRKRNKPV